LSFSSIFRDYQNLMEEEILNWYNKLIG
jgi:hypothetical protein